MIVRLIILIALLIAAATIIQIFRKTPQSQLKDLYWKFALGTTALALMLLAVTGKIHWIGAMIAAMIPLARRALPFLIRYLPQLQQYQKNRNQSQSSNKQQQSSTDNTVDESSAYAILGLTKTATKEDVIRAHRRMMQKVHPDRGGSDFLAAQINAAKDLLVDKLA